MENDSLKNLLKRIETGYSLPSLSPVAIKLVEIASDDACSIEELISLIEKDPSLAVNLLKMANSAFFKSGQPVASLQQAIMRIGFHQLRIMGLSMSLRNTFPMGKVGPLDYENFWRVSLYRGLIAKSLAQRLKSCNPDEAFVAGLILEVGFLIFFDLLIKGKTEEVIPDLSSLEELLQWEDDHYGINHRVIGEAALGYWKFPDKIVECQKDYGEAAMDQKTAPLTRVCELARVLSYAMLHKETDFHILFSGARELYGLSDDVINDIILATFEEVEEIAGSLKLELNKERDLLELIEKANQGLGRISEKINRYQNKLSHQDLPAFETLGKGEEKSSVEYTLQAVAHEIRNPLVSVAGFAKRLAKTLDPESQGGKYVHIILEEAKRLETALNEMTR